MFADIILIEGTVLRIEFFDLKCCDKITRIRRCWRKVILIHFCFKKNGMRSKRSTLRVQTK